MIKIKSLTELPNHALFMLLCGSEEEAEEISSKYSSTWFWSIKSSKKGYLYIPYKEYNTKQVLEDL